jgi:predicted DNA-binding protein (MmcQ/YjbR family)
MDIEKLRDYCLAKKHTNESFPFDEDTLVFKIGGKIFALISLKKADFVNLKCDPETAINFREQYNAVQPGYHMNKKHWNTIYFNQDVDDSFILNCIDHSYDLVVNSLTKKLKNELFG